MKLSDSGYNLKFKFPEAVVWNCDFLNHLIILMKTIAISTLKLKLETTVFDNSTKLTK